ncbi:MAG: cyclic nucleotide-binding domain-containing protein [Betaproteobacteria bacterium]|nr:cyclic nucleotide-binding domain-containing protein [Betaproteobacteria bacterium]
MEQKVDIQQFLKLQPGFESLSASEVATFAQMMHVALFPAKHIFNLKSDVGHTLYLIMDGAVTMKSDDPLTGIEEVHLLRVGEWFGLLSLVENLPAIGGFSASEHVTVASFNRVQFNDLFDAAPNVGRLLLYMLTKQLARALIFQNKKLSRKSQHVTSI